DLPDPGDLRRRLGGRPRFPRLAGHQRIDRAQPARGGDGGEHRVLHRAALMLDENQRLHAANPSVFSLATSSSTEPTTTPACRTGGSATLSTFSRGETSTP